MDAITPTAGADDIHARLAKIVQRRRTSYLWVKGDTPSFKPALLPARFGDGRALFQMTTVNQRPRYWVIRCCSTWTCDMDRVGGDGPNFGEVTDDILTALDEHFGRGRCGYSGNSLFFPKRERLQNCKCEDCVEGPMARWPMVDDEGGYSWSRMDWPSEFATQPHPLCPRYNLLAV